MRLFLLMFLIAVSGLAACQTPAGVSGGSTISEVGSFYIGGRRLVVSGQPVRTVKYTAPGAPREFNPNGDTRVGQAYVQYLRVSGPKAPYPILMLHGGGLTGATWETTPDGRPGFQMLFAKAGFDVYIVDEPARGRASWNPNADEFKDPPLMRTNKEAWELFRIGPLGSYKSDDQRESWSDSKFPIGHYEKFADEIVPRWTTTGALVEETYGAIVDQVCPCILITHSNGGFYGFRLAFRSPDKIKALISLEPSEFPNGNQFPLTSVSNVPQLVVWGDHTKDYPFWDFRVDSFRQVAQRLRAVGADVEVLELPRIGIHGNGHMLMMDKNNDQIAGRIVSWLKERRLTSP
jgi:pimeloyl-ACP methyl ester carboxylesterase